MQKRQLLEEISIVEGFAMLALVYEEIAVLEMQKIRGRVLRTREFTNDLASLFEEVRSSYRRQIMALIKKNQKKILSKTDRQVISFSTLLKNGKSVLVLLSANTKLYGDIVPRTFTAFLKAARKDPQADLVIVGRLGRQLFDQDKSVRKYTYFPLHDIQVALTDLKAITSHIVKYEKVTVYYGKFINVIEQEPISTIISGEHQIDTVNTSSQSVFRFLFEPELEKILNFFETQIFTAFFKQTVHEYQLARHASRIRAMEFALSNIASASRNLEVEKRKIKRGQANKKQLASLSGINLWER